MLWLTLLITLSVNIVLIFLMAWFFSRAYDARFQELISIVQDAMAERDAKLQKVRAMLAKAFVTDTSLFDALLDEEDVLNDNEESNPARDQ